jgi:hypothetical protein
MRLRRAVGEALARARSNISGNAYQRPMRQAIMSSMSPVLQMSTSKLDSHCGLWLWLWLLDVVCRVLVVWAVAVALMREGRAESSFI